MCQLEIKKIYIYGLKTQYAPNFPSECPQSGVCNFALIFFENIQPYFSQLFLKIHPPEPAQVNGVGPPLLLYLATRGPHQTQQSTRPPDLEVNIVPIVHFYILAK